jgi:predicted transcriptional regulator
MPSLSQLQREQLGQPTNVDILIHLMERPATLIELANELNLVPLEIGFRLRQLTDAGMVQAVQRETAGSRQEKYYEAAIDDLEYVIKPSNDINRNANQVRLLSMLLRKDLLYHATHPDQEASRVHMMMIGIRCNPTVFNEFLERMTHFEHDFNAADDPEQDQWHYMTVAMYDKPVR